MFVPTTASENVENLIRSKNLVIVAGHPGCGKTAIVNHIALKYRKNGWFVKPVEQLKEIKQVYMSGKFKQNKTIFVLNDPIGRESLSEILYTIWKQYEKTLKTVLQNVKIVLTSRKCIIFDTRVKGLFQDRTNIVVVDDNQNKLSHSEKKTMLKKYTTSEDITEENTLKIIENEICFPLLCKMFSSYRKHFKDVVKFFTEPMDVLKEEIQNCKEFDKEMFCGLVCLVFFNNNLSQQDLIVNGELFKKCLELCDIRASLPPITVMKKLKLFDGFFVKNVCDNYHFSHDFVMEVTSFLFGSDYPKEMLKHADIGFLQRRVRLENYAISGNPFTVILSDPYINDLVQRLSEDIFKDRFIEVVLNPCLKNEYVIDQFVQRMQKNPNALQMIVKQNTMKNIKQEIDFILKDNLFSRLDFVNMFQEVSPLFALIVFRHDKLSRFFLNALQKEQETLSEQTLFPAICSNGAEFFYNMISKHKFTKYLIEDESILHPIHIVSIFNNYKLLSEIVEQGIDVNMITKSKYAWTPMTLAAANKDEESSEKFHLSPRDETFRTLLEYGAKINMCTKNGISPLYMACQNGHESTVKVLLDKGAEVNLCTENGKSPLFISCQNGHDKLVHLLMKGAKLNLCSKTGICPLFIACQNGYDKTVNLLLNFGADINLCNRTGTSPLFIACENGHDSTVNILLNNDANVNSSTNSGASPLSIACEKGHESIVQTLLSKNADVNFCKINSETPLYKACEKGHNSTIQMLLKNGADVNLCDNKGKTLLYTACENEHNDIVQLLLNNDADVNFCTSFGESLLYIASKIGQNKIVQCLLNYGADVNLCDKCKRSPLYIACEKGHESIVQLLLNNGADVSLCNIIGRSPLFVASEKGHNGTVQILLNNGADVNFCDGTGISPFYKACENGHNSIAQLLLNNGADVNVCNYNRESLLCMASK